MKKENYDKKNKLKIAKILSVICLSLILAGIFIIANKSEKTSNFSEVKEKNNSAADIVTSKAWGGCYWKIDGDGKLWITANNNLGSESNFAAGEMGNMADETAVPWYSYRAKIKTAQIGQGAAYNPTTIRVKENFRIVGMFYDCTNLTSIDFVNYNFRNATSMDSLFYNCKSLKTLNGFEDYRAAKATNMSHVFYNCSSLKSITIGEYFNSESATTMRSMFYGCTSLTTINGFSRLKTATVTDMSYMFHNCSSLTSLTFGSNFNTSNVNDMTEMFSNCSSLQSITIGTTDF